MKIIPLDLNFLGKPNTIAAYLIIGPDGPVLVETGPMSTLSTLKNQLAEQGYVADDIHHLLVTHIHLDHAGAAGWWAQQGTRVYVHHIGAPHLIDPAKLLSSAARIYGDQMNALWGQTLPAPAEFVTPVYDGDQIAAGGLTFTALDTPGHAYHHHVYRVSDIGFTGDAAGIHIAPPSKEAPEKSSPSLVDLPAPPPEFDLERWQQTIDKLLAQPFRTLYPTHYGRVDNWTRQLETLSALLSEATEFVRLRLDEGLARSDILSDYLAWHATRCRKAGLNDQQIAQYEAANPHFMSVDGIIRYWRKREQSNTG
jgi:glyoxylase-like metal-dependent hydrolase (beta-lactamase superfamily II)